MGWWALDLKRGGIDWENRIAESNELVWGDSPADVVDAELSKLIPVLHKECNKMIQKSFGRPMDPREFLCGLAFSLNGIEQHEEKLFGKDLPFTLKVEVGEVIEKGDGEE